MCRQRVRARTDKNNEHKRNRAHSAQPAQGGDDGERNTFIRSRGKNSDAPPKADRERALVLRTSALLWLVTDFATLSAIYRSFGTQG